MSSVLEITQLDNGDIVLVESDDTSSEPVVRIRFSGEVRDMLGDDLVGIAEAMIDAASLYIDSNESPEARYETTDGEPHLDADDSTVPVDVIVH